MSWLILVPAQGGDWVYRAAISELARTVFPPQAFAAARSSFRPWIGRRGQSPDKSATGCRSTAWRASRRPAPDSRASPDHSAASATLLASSGSLLRTDPL